MREGDGDGGSVDRSARGSASSACADIAPVEACLPSPVTSRDASTVEPPVSELLDIDREFRKQSRRVLHTMRHRRRYTALFSPTSMARRLGRANDWVILDLERPGPNGRWTVVTERRGVSRGRRVVRGREVECYHYYRERRLFPSRR